MHTSRDVPGADDRYDGYMKSHSTPGEDRNPGVSDQDSLRRRKV